MDYLDFELEVLPEPGGDYEVRVLHSPAGEAKGILKLPFDRLALENRLQALQIALLKAGGRRRRLALPEAQTVQDFGSALWDSLFTENVLSSYDVSRSEARRQGKGLRLKIRLGAPELASLPWEYLYDDRRGDYLALTVTTPLVRYVALQQPVEPLAVAPPLRILAMVADPDDLEELDIQRERQRLEEALARLKANGLVEVRWITTGTWRDLREALRHGPWHVFHFVGHGGFSKRLGEGVLALVGDDGHTYELSATDLGRFLGGHDALRLAVLNSCDSAKPDQVDVFSSTAAVLVRQGTPAVVAMQFEITDAAAIEFSRSFYEAIADGLPVDTAVSEARQGIALSIPDSLEWGTPVLFTRAPDGALFSIPADRLASTVIDRTTPPPFVLDRRASGEEGRAYRLRRVAAVSWRRASRVGRLRAAIAVVALSAVLAVALLFRPDAAPALSLSLSEGGPGAIVRVEGRGFGPGESVKLKVGGEVRRTITATSDGSFSVDVTFPSDVEGSVVVEAVGETSGRTDDAPFRFVAAAASPSPSSSPSPTPDGSEIAGGSPGPSDGVGPSASLGPSQSTGPQVTPPPRTPTPAPQVTAKPKTPPPPTPPPTPAPTPVPTHAIVVDNDVNMAPTAQLNADNGAITATGSDLRFDMVSASERYMTPRNGARIVHMSTSVPSYSTCAAAPVGTGQIRLDAIDPGDWFCVRTSNGKVSRLQLLSLSDSLELKVQTWN